MSVIVNERDKLLQAAPNRLGVLIAGINGLITNEHHGLPADAAGNVTSYAGATGEFKVFSGSTDISSNFTLSTFSNPQALTIGYVGRVYTVSAGFDAAEQIAAVTIRATGNAGTVYSGLVIDKVFSLGKVQAGVGAFTLVARGFTKMLSANSITKQGGITGWGDADAYSVEGFTGGAYVSWQMGQNNKFCMVALNSDPLTNQSYDSLDFAIEPLNNGNFDIYESGVPRGLFGTYDTNTVFTIIYDGADVKYLKDGVVVRTVAGVGANLKFHLDTALYDQDVVIKNLAFGPVGARGANGANGANGTNGTNGTRGSIEVLGSGTSWSDATADAAILAATGSSLRVFGDSATIIGSGFAETRRWNGSAWVNPGQVFHGNMFVTGSINTAQLFVGAASAASTGSFSVTLQSLPSGSTTTNLTVPTTAVSLTTTGAPVKMAGVVQIHMVRQAAGVPANAKVTAIISVDGSSVGQLPVTTHTGPFRPHPAGTHSECDICLPIVKRWAGPSLLSAAAHTFQVVVSIDAWYDAAGNALTFGGSGTWDVACEFFVEENKV